MRTTLAIDDDVLAAARHLAGRERRSVGEVISALARQGLNKGARAAPACAQRSAASAHAEEGHSRDPQAGQ